MSRAPPAPIYRGTETPEARLTACQALIRDATRHCGDYDRRGLDFEDMLQEATIAVFLEIKKYPTAPVGYIWQVAHRTALHVLRSGRSVDSPRTDRRVNYRVVSLETLLEDKDGRDIVEEALARRKRRGEIPDPTAEVAVARVMCQELWKRLTPRQRQVLDLRLQQYSEAEAGAVLGISQAQVHRLVVAIRAKARAAWADEPPKPGRPKLTPEEAREQRRERDRLKMRRRYALHREELNARRRVWLNSTRAQWREQGRCSRCGGAPDPGHRICPDCRLRSRLDRGRARLRRRLERKRDGQGWKQEGEEVLVQQEA